MSTLNKEKHEGNKDTQVSIPKKQKQQNRSFPQVYTNAELSTSFLVQTSIILSDPSSLG